MSQSDIVALVVRTRRIPEPVVNRICAMIFAAETLLGFLVPCPWGMSILGLYRKH